METNILGLPSFTGFTPLKAAQKEQILKYDFKGIGPRVLDKSGNLNGGMLEPRWPVNAPRRQPFPAHLVFDGEDDFIKSAHIDLNDRNFSIVMDVTVSSLDHDMGLFGQKEEATVNKWLHGRIYTDGRIRFGFFNNDLTTSSGVISPNERVKIAFVYDYGEGEQRVKVEGEVVDRRSSEPYQGTKGKTIFGNTLWGEFFDGMFHRVSVYRKAI